MGKGFEMTDDQIKAIAGSMQQLPYGIGSRLVDAVAFARAILSADQMRVDQEPTVELHVPVTITKKQSAKLADGVCSLVTRHDIPVERVKVVAKVTAS